MAEDADGRPAVWEAVEAAMFEHDGATYTIVPGTTFADGHPVVRARPALFKPFTPDYGWAQPSDAPRSQVKADQRGARTR
jgi:hypothetical protein